VINKYYVLIIMNKDKMDFETIKEIYFKNLISVGFWQSKDEPNLPMPKITKNKYIDGFEEK
jgi:hypothetical protein